MGIQAADILAGSRAVGHSQFWAGSLAFERAVGQSASAAPRRAVGQYAILAGSRAALHLGGQSGSVQPRAKFHPRRGQRFRDPRPGSRAVRN